MTKNSMRWSLGLALILTLVGACDNPARDGEVGWLKATIQDATTTQFEGAGFFEKAGARDGPVRLPDRLNIRSSVSDDSVNQNLLIFRAGAGILPVGSYALGPLEDTDGVLLGFTAYYSRNLEGKSESFSALSGQLEITESSGSRVEGTFVYTGVQYCLIYDQGSHDDQFCGDPNTIYPGAPQVEVAGSFSATPTPAGVVNEN